MKELSLRDKQAYVIGLSVGCPLGHALDSCILLDIREKHLRSRFQAIKGMDEARLTEIIDHHHACFETRTGLSLDYA